MRLLLSPIGGLIDSSFYGSTPYGVQRGKKDSGWMMEEDGPRLLTLTPY